VSLRLVEQRDHVMVRKRVDPPGSTPFDPHEGMLAKHPQLVRDGGLFKGEQLGQLGDVMGPIEQRVEDLDPGRGRERKHRIRDLGSKLR
jgi:hypothetical protein